MKLLKFLIPMAFAMVFTTCKKDTIVKTVHVADTVYVDNQTLTLHATRDAAIFIDDNIEAPQYGDNGDGASDLLRVGYADEYSTYMRSLVGFDVSSIPANAVIVSATLSFTMGKSGNSLLPVGVYKLTQDWTEGSADDNCVFVGQNCTSHGGTPDGDVTWFSTTDGGAFWTTAGGSFVSTASAIAEGGIVNFSSPGLVSDVTSWMATPSSNFGWILMMDEENLTKGGGEQLRLYSREASTAKAREEGAAGADPTTKPTLTIVYHQ